MEKFLNKIIATRNELRVRADEHRTKAEYMDMNADNLNDIYNELNRLLDDAETILNCSFEELEDADPLYDDGDADDFGEDDDDADEEDN